MKTNKTSAIIIMGLFAILRPANASPDLADKLKASNDKLQSLYRDAQRNMHDLRGEEAEFGAAMMLTEKITEALCHVFVLDALVSVGQSVHDENDKRTIDKAISSHIEAFSREPNVNQIDNLLPHLKNEALLRDANKLKDDMRELVDLPKPIP